ncbi:MAG: SurA N-terminal domain-containing protein, partial [Ekhidna sp.]
MALIGILRNKMGKIVVGAIMVTMVAFIGTDLIGNSSLIGGGDNPDIAEIAGAGISNTQFQNKVDELSYNFALNTGRNPLQQETDQIRNQAWNAL